MSEILVSGLTIIRNGVRLNYPFIEAIRSALPICDEYIVVAGDSDDETLEYLARLDDENFQLTASIHELVARTLGGRIAYMNRRLMLELS